VTRRYTLLLAILGIVAREPQVRANSTGCGQTSRPWVELDTHDFAPEIPIQAFVSLLGAELGSHGLDLCTSGDGPNTAVATVRVSPRPDGIALTIEVHDALTDKQVSRDVVLHGVPLDGRPLTVAIAADELLRASWAELALRTAGPPTRPVPSEVTETVRDAISLSPKPAGLVEIGVALTWQQYTRGLVLYGAEARAALRVTNRLRLGAQFGVSRGVPLSSVDGSVDSTSWSLTAAGLCAITPAENRWHVDAVFFTALEELALLPTPSAGARASEQSGYAFLVGAGPQTRFTIRPGFELAATALAIVPLRGVDATDGGRQFAGLSGLGWEGQLGFLGTP